MCGQYIEDRRFNLATAKTADRDNELVLPAYGDRKMDFVVGEDFEKTVIWIRQAYVYDNRGVVSLCFVLANCGENIQFTTRVYDRMILDDGNSKRILMYKSRMKVKIGEVTNSLAVYLCDTDIADAPAVISRDDYRRFVNPISAH